MLCMGVVAEWNPFHRGHQRLLEEAGRKGATHLVAVMSGNFTQRGEPAVCPWPYRARAALRSGCDLILQLPLPYAVGTAERFASGSIELLTALGVPEAVIFGSEAGEIGPLREIADILDDGSFSAALLEILGGGVSYAAARGKAIQRRLGAEAAGRAAEPNNILGVEYLAAIRRQNSPLRAETVRRSGSRHDCLSPGPTPSARRIREEMRSGVRFPEGLTEAMAEELGKAEEAGAVFDVGLWERPFLQMLRARTREEFASVPDLSEGLEHRLYRETRKAESPEALLRALKTKRYSLSRLRRLLTAACLGIEKDLVRTPIPYIRILGMNSRGREILHAARERATLPISPSLRELGMLSPAAGRFAALEERATDCYGIGLRRVPPCGEELTEFLIRV